ncbi:MAG: hypothetical protein PHO15_07640 [Eubacteriales bacterium]|nr:hypothetical protein [Eubacteriales bacterium]
MDRLMNISAGKYFFSFTSQGYYYSYWYFAFKKFIRRITEWVA